jgi:hypothetical protein
MTPLFKKFLGMNWLLIVLNMAGLIVFGVYAIFNASAHKEEAEFALQMEGSDPLGGSWACLSSSLPR